MAPPGKAIRQSRAGGVRNWAASSRPSAGGMPSIKNQGVPSNAAHKGVPTRCHHSSRNSPSAANRRSSCRPEHATHIATCSGRVPRFPYAPNRRYTPEDAPKETLAALHDHLGVERAVIVQASCHGADNRAMLDAIAWRPDRYRGVAIVDQSYGEAELAICTRAACAGSASTSSAILAARRTWTCSIGRWTGSGNLAGTWCCTWTRPTSCR